MAKPLILHSPLTGNYYMSTRYTVKEKYIVTHTKTDVTDQVMAILEPYKTQRDDLLKACKVALERLREFEFISLNSPNTIPILEAAIAKAEEVAERV